MASALFADPSLRGPYEDMTGLLYGGGMEGPAPGTTTGPSGYGTMTEGQRSTVAGLGLGARGIGLAGTLAGLTAPAAVGVMGTPVAAILGLDKLFGWMGFPSYSPNPWAGMISPADIQGIKDYFGEFAARDAIARNESITRDVTSRPEDPGRLGNDLGPEGPSGVSPGAAAGSVGRGDVGGADPGNFYARGGVRMVRTPTNLIAGEAGPEQAIFIPASMKRPGIQGRELAVRRAIMQAMHDLWR